MIHLKNIMKIFKICLAGFCVFLLVGCSSVFNSKNNETKIDRNRMHYPARTPRFIEEQGSFGRHEGIVGDKNDMYGYSAGFDNAPAPSENTQIAEKQSYYFGFDKYDVEIGDFDSIRTQANYLISHPRARIRLEGNADERGSREYNIALGWRRVRAVANILKEQGITDRQIIMLSYGKERPIAFGNDEASHRLNRRVDLIYEVK